MKKCTNFLLLVGALVLSQMGWAQYGGSPGFSRQASLSINQYIQRQELRSAVNRRVLMNRTNRLSNTEEEIKTAKKIIAKGPSSFTEKALILPEQFVASLKDKTEAEKKAARSKLESYWATYKEVALKDGFPTNDIAYAFNYYLVHNYAVFINYFEANKNQKRTDKNGKLETDEAFKERTNLNITIPVEQKIYDQYRAYFDADATVTEMTNEQKQLFVELLVAITNFTFDNYGKALNSNDTVGLEQLSDVAKNNLETFFGLGVEKIKITEDGLQILD